MDDVNGHEPSLAQSRGRRQRGRRYFPRLVLHSDQASHFDARALWPRSEKAKAGQLPLTRLAKDDDQPLGHGLHYAS